MFRDSREEIMKIAIPAKDNHIPELLSQAESFIIAEVSNNQIVNETTIPVDTENILENLKCLIQNNVRTLIVYDMNKNLKEQAANNFIVVYPWVQGDIHSVIDRFLNSDFNYYY